MTGIIVLVIVGAILLTFKLLLDWSSRREALEDIKGRSKDQPLTKAYCESLILQAIEEGEKLNASKEPLVIDDSLLSTWQQLPTVMTSFLTTHGRVYFESGGSVGGHIYPVSDHKEILKLLERNKKEGKRFAQGVIFGTDEGEVFFALPKEDQVFSVNCSLGRIDGYAHFFELLACSAGLTHEVE